MVLYNITKKVAQGLTNKTKSVVVRMHIPANINPNDNLYDSIHWSGPDSEGNLYVGSDVPHAPIVESGRLPGEAPPFQPIYEWVKKKLQIEDEKQAKRVAWAVVHHIETEGIKARRFMKISLEEFIRGV